MEKIVLVGGGGHCKVIIDAIREACKYSIHGIVDPNLNTEEEVMGVRVLGNDALLEEISKKGVKNAFISVGSTGDCGLRKKLYDAVKSAGYNVPVIVHPKAVVAKDVEMGEGTFVAASATINTGTKIGKNTIINTSSSIDHDCTVGDFVHIAPGVTMGGGVLVEEGWHIGLGSNICQNVEISHCQLGDKKPIIRAQSMVYRSDDAIMVQGMGQITVEDENV